MNDTPYEKNGRWPVSTTHNVNARNRQFSDRSHANHSVRRTLCQNTALIQNHSEAVNVEFEYPLLSCQSLGLRPGTVSWTPGVSA